ncbi:MAG: adenylate/guanylate cyclase domain-containing protein [Pseudomonadota bacterium]
MLRELAKRLVADGMPLCRASFHIRTLHPQLFGVGFFWQRGSDEIRVFEAKHGIQETAIFQNSPMRALFEGAGGVRQRLDLPDAELAFPLLQELRKEGLTDYVALPMTFSDGKIHGTTWSSDQPGGFTSDDLAQIDDLLPAYSLLLEIHFNRRIAINILDTYVGHQAGERILAGQITRGSVQTVQAAIWFCDLRGFTALSESEESDEILDCLNLFFDCMAGPVEEQGGEVLKFIGDAMLAVFPLDIEGACKRATHAALGACEAMGKLNQKRRTNGQDPLGFGIALHLGEVMYGNVGAADRLDFTVIGPAVNLASRLEGLCRTLDVPVLVSDDFVGRCAGDFRSLGDQHLAGISRPVEVFTLPQAHA